MKEHVGSFLRHSAVENGIRRVEQREIYQLQSTETVSAQHDLLQTGGWGETGKGIKGGECGRHFFYGRKGI